MSGPHPARGSSGDATRIPHSQTLTILYTRQTLYNRLYKGKLTPIYWDGDPHDLRFLKGENEAWKTQREQRSPHEE